VTEPQEQASGRPLPPVETRFKPGQSGNPGGRPRGASVLAPLLRKLAANPNEHGEGAEANAAAETILALLRQGNGKELTGLLKILDRTDGPVPKDVNHGVQEGCTVEIHGVKVTKPPPMPEDAG